MKVETQQQAVGVAVVMAQSLAEAEWRLCLACESPVHPEFERRVAGSSGVMCDGCYDLLEDVR